MRLGQWGSAGFALMFAMAAGAVPATLPVQGVITDADGAPLDGTVSVAFTVYEDAAGTTSVFTETRDVSFAEGFFAVYLGDQAALDLAQLASLPSAYLGIAVNGDDEMDLIELGTVPFAAAAEFCAEATTLQGLSPADLTLQSDDLDWSRLTSVPAGLDDGDDDTTYAAKGNSGIELVGGEFSLLSSCAVGNVLKRTATGWDCAADESAAGGGTISDVTLTGTTLNITESGIMYNVSLAGLQDGVNDADSNPSNELNSSLVLSGTTLQLTDNGGTLSANLAALQDGVNDADSNPSNELNSSLVLSGTTLQLTDNGGTLSANLAALQDGVNDADADPTNETNQSMTLSGTTLQLTDSAGTVSADLSSLAGGAGNNQMVSAAGSTTTPTATRAFLSVRVSATVAPADMINIQSSAAFGSVNAAGAGGLDIYPCYRVSGSTATPSTIGLGMFNLQVPQNTRMPFAINGVVTGLNGTYEFGMCGDDDGDGNWDNNEWSYTSIVVTRN